MGGLEGETKYSKGLGVASRTGEDIGGKERGAKKRGVTEGSVYRPGSERQEG